MAAPSNTATTVAQVGNREALTNILERVAPEATPFTSNIGAAQGVDVKGVFLEWQTETLATPSTSNAKLEGDDPSTYSNNNPTRVGNYFQILDKPFAVSGTQEVVDKAGRKSEIARLTTIKSMEIKRDFEAECLENGASRAESGSNARLCGGILAWCETNTSRGSGGTDGGFSSGVVAAAGNGTQRTFTEALLKTVMQSIFNESGTAKTRTAYMSAAHKQAFSTFTGIADIRTKAEGKTMPTIYGAAEAYMSDFGMIMTVPVAYGLTRDVLIADHDYLGVGTLRPLQRKRLGYTGDREEFQPIMEKTLVVKNEAANGVIADLS